MASSARSASSRRPAQVAQGNAFSVPVAHLAVQFQRMPVQIESLSRLSQQEIGIGEAVRGLCLAYPVADLTSDRERPLDVTDAFVIADIAEGFA